MSLEKLPNFLVNFFDTEMNNGTRRIYQFGQFSLDVAERQLFELDAPVRLTPKAFDVLAFLVANGGHLVSKDELMNAVWPDAFIEEVNIPRTIHTLRRALSEDKNGNKFIETVPTKGYRFVADIKETIGNCRTIGVVEPISEELRSGEVGSSMEILEAYEGEGFSTSTDRRNWPRTWIFVSAAILLLLAGTGAAILLLTRFQSANSAAIGKRSTTISGEAYQHYQHGRFLVERRRTVDFDEALKSFEKAIELDPSYADAYAAKADVQVIMSWGPATAAHENMTQARAAVQKALEIDRSNSYAHAVLCRILSTYYWDHTEAEKECRRAVELDPNDHEAQKELGFMLNSLGREREALEAMDKAVAIAPTSFNKRCRGMVLYYSRRYDEAIAQFEQVDETDPEYGETSRWLSRAYDLKEDYGNALEWYLRYIQFSGAMPEETDEIRKAFVSGGWLAVRRGMIDGPYIRRMFRAGVFAQMGENDKAFEIFEEMFQRRASLLVTLARDPILDPLRSDPRYHVLLKRIGLGN